MQVQLFEENIELKLKLQETTEKMVMVHVFYLVRMYMRAHIRMYMHTYVHI